MTGSSETRRAAVLLYPGCTVAETIGLSTRLADAGIEISHVGRDRNRLRDRSGLLVEPDLSIGETDGVRFDVVIVPGGDPGEVMTDERILGFVAGAEDGGSTVAGICAGVLVMAAAGLLAGQSITHNYRHPWAADEVIGFVERFWAGATVEPDPTVGVVVDGPIVTALPNATIEFTTTVCQRLGLYDDAKADLIRRHLSGQFVPQLHDEPR